jgi:hypothetical protein
VGDHAERPPPRLIVAVEGALQHDPAVAGDDDGMQVAQQPGADAGIEALAEIGAKAGGDGGDGGERERRYN